MMASSWPPPDEALWPLMLEDAWWTSGGHLQDLWRPLGHLLRGVGRMADGGLLYFGAACEALRPRMLEDTW
jgi:hypothetical protein